MIVILEKNLVTFGAQTCHFASLVPPTLASWGTMGRSRGTWEHEKGDLGVQAWIFIDFGWISEPIVRAFRAPLTNICVFVHA
jgi:hypothetical protein